MGTTRQMPAKRNSTPPSLHVRLWSPAGLVAFSLVVVSVSTEVLAHGFSVFAASSRHIYVLLSLLVGLLILRGRLRRPRLDWRREAILIIAWFSWCLVLVSTAHVALFDGKWFPDSFRLILVGVIAFVVFSGTLIPIRLRLVMLGLATGGAFIILLTWFSGRLSVRPETLMRSRLGEVVAGNSNTFAYLLLVAVFATTYLAEMWRSGRLKAAAVLLLGILTVGIVLSGSRKAFLGEATFFGLLFVLHLRRRLILSGQHMILGTLAACLVLGVAGYTLERSVMGTRLREAYQGEQRAQGMEDRMAGRGSYYTQATKLFIDRPVLGYGLGNFRRFERTGTPAHSDFISLLIGSGIPGFTLYFSIYAIILVRLFRIRRSANPLLHEHFTASLFIAALSVVLILATGRWNYDHVPTYVLLGAAAQFSAYGYAGKSTIPAVSDGDSRISAGPRIRNAGESLP